MKIAVFGATGGLGQPFVKAALENDHEILAYVRSPEKITYQHEHLRVIVGDVFDKVKMTETLHGMDAVLISWRMRSQKIPLFSEGTQNVIEAMKAQNVKNLIVMSEYATGNHFRNFGFIMRVLTKLYIKMVKFQQNERDLQELAVLESGLEWIIIRIRGLTEKGAKECDITFEPKSKVGAVSYVTGAKKVLDLFEHPADYINKNVYF